MKVITYLLPARINKYMKCSFLFFVYFKSFILLFGCDNRVSSDSPHEKGGGSLLLTDKPTGNGRDSVEIIFDACFLMVENHLARGSDLSDPYFVMDLPKEINIDKSIIEISIKIEGIRGRIIVNGITPEAISGKYQAFKAKEYTEKKSLRSKEVSIHIKKIIQSTTLKSDAPQG
jgi:hypothetical protein